jgi:type II secretory pathway component GspD/PulD (secretin)
MTNKAKRLILVVLASALSCAAFAQGKLTGVQWKKVGEGVEVQIQGSDLDKPKTTWTNSHRSYVLEFDASFTGKTGTKRINSAGVRYVTFGRYSSRPPKARVHVNLLPGAAPELFQTDTGWILAVGETGTKTRLASAKRTEFPETVPPLDKPFTMNKVIEKMTASPTKPLPSTAPGTTVLERKVSLMFEDTEIVQILKALALQADVNIVTAPEVKGKLSVSLNDVNVQQALDFVTTLAGVRYALVGNTFVVATNERFANAMRQITNGQEQTSQTRIIGLASGEGAQIKATVLKAVPQESIHGRYDILLPTEMLTLETKATTQATSTNAPITAGAGAGAAATGDAQKTDITAKAEAGGNAVRPKDMYIVLVGLPQRLNEVERVVREVDSRIADANKVVIGKDIDTSVVPIYSGRVSEVATAVRRVVDRDPKRELYNIQESNTGGPNEPDSVKLLLISGPLESVKNVESFARGIDEGLCRSMGIEYPETQEDQARSFEILDLMWVEPIEAAAELQKQIPGLRASLLPGPVRPNVRGTKSVTMGAAESGTSTETNVANSGLSLGVKGGGSTGGGSAANAGAASGGSTGNSLAGAAGSSQEEGASLTRSLGTEPMKLMVRGTRAQIVQAREFLSVYDVAPRQVALELRVMEMTKEDALKVGLDWSALTGGAVQMIRVNQGINASQSIPGTVGADVEFGRGGSADVTATLDKLAGAFKMVARPNILASEGRPTTIFVGDEVRYVESIVSSANAGPTITTGQVNVGVRLIVTPRIGAGGNITMDLNPEMSVLKGFLDVPGGGQLPQTSLRSTTSMVQLKSGETLAIGGLIQESDRQSVSGIPLLMDLPIIGHLFKRTNNSKVRTEVVFFLTVTEVNAGNRGTAADPRESEKKIKPELNGGKG